MAHRIETVERGAAVNLRIDGKPVSAFAGETIATVLLVNDVTEFHRTAGNRPRGPFCNMGACFECLVRIDNTGWVRACVTPVHEGMNVLTGLCFADSLLPQSERHED